MYSLQVFAVVKRQLRLSTWHNLTPTIWTFTKLMLEIFLKFYLIVPLSLYQFLFDRVPRMNKNLFGPHTNHIVVTCVLYHSRISWSWRNIKTYIMHSGHLSVKAVIKYSFARVFCICIYACVVKIVHSTVWHVIASWDARMVWRHTSLQLVRSSHKSGVMKRSCLEF